MKHLVTIALLVVAQPAWASGVEVRRNVVYYDGPGQDEYRHRLDLYVPLGEKNFKTVIFVHGGTWSMGSKDGFLMLPGHKAADHGKFFAEKGIAAVHVNYRLSPKVKHPEHVTDVARAIGWVKNNIANYGGDPEQLYLMGHSAGGHLVALVTCDPKYLTAEKVDGKCIKGVIGVSGVYALTADLTECREPMEAGQPTGAGVLLGHVFGNDCKCHHQASPIQQCRPGLPPFLIAYADRDLLTLPAQAVAFQEALAKKNVPAKKLLVTGREHQTILKNMLNAGDPLGEAVLKLVRTGQLD
jgi:acetyl esterase/lipase